MKDEVKEFLDAVQEEFGQAQSKKFAVNMMLSVLRSRVRYSKLLPGFPKEIEDAVKIMMIESVTEIVNTYLEENENEQLVGNKREREQSLSDRNRDDEEDVREHIHGVDH